MVDAISPYGSVCRLATELTAGDPAVASDQSGQAFERLQELTETNRPGCVRSAENAPMLNQRGTLKASLMPRYRWRNQTAQAAEDGWNPKAKQDRD